MSRSALETFIAAVRPVWGELSSELVRACRKELEQLLQASASEPWLAALQAEAPASRELYRDPDHGFVLQAHIEPAGTFRPPHDHGRSWVIYGVQQGEIEMSTYARIASPDGQVRLVERDKTLVCAGQVQVYLPGDIHATRALKESARLFRFSERDLKAEDKQHGRVTRYVCQDGFWTVGAQ